MKFNKYVRSRKFGLLCGLVAVCALIVWLIPPKAVKKPLAFNLSEREPELSLKPLSEKGEQAGHGFPRATALEQANPLSMVPEPAAGRPGGIAVEKNPDLEKGQPPPGGLEDQDPETLNPPQHLAAAISGLQSSRIFGVGSPAENKRATTDSRAAPMDSCCSSNPEHGSPPSDSHADNNETVQQDNSPGSSTSPGHGGGGSGSIPLVLVPRPNVSPTASTPCCQTGDLSEEGAFVPFLPTDDQATPFNDEAPFPTLHSFSPQANTPYVGTSDLQDTKAIPEPGLIFLMACGLIGFLLFERKRHGKFCVNKN